MLLKQVAWVFVIRTQLAPMPPRRGARGVGRKKKKKKKQPILVELTPEEKALQIREKIEREKLEREAKYKLHLEERKLRIIKKYWHDSFVCRAQPEEILQIDPIQCNNARQALAIDIYGAKSIVNQMKVQTICELYNAYCEACKRGAEHLFQFRRKLENALSSKQKTVQVMFFALIIVNGNKKVQGI